MIESGYKATEKSIWVVEGLLVYLRDEDIATLLTNLSELTCEGSMLCGDWMNRSYLTSKITEPFRGIFERLGSPFINGSDAMPTLFASYGFEISLKMLGEGNTNYGNRLPSNQVKVAERYPVSDSQFDFIPRHLLFSGLRVSTNQEKREKTAEGQEREAENNKEKEKGEEEMKGGSVEVKDEEGIERVVRDVVSLVLGNTEIQHLPRGEDLFSVGVGSLEAVDIAVLLKDKFAPRLNNLSLDLVFHSNTIHALTTAIWSIIENK